MTTTENAQRDELAVGIMEAYFEANDGCGSRHWQNMAGTLLAAGYRKPRTVATVGELDALHTGAVIRADNGEVFEKQADGPYCDGPHDWQSMEGTFWNGETFIFPVTVLWETEAEAAQ